MSEKMSEKDQNINASTENQNTINTDAETAFENMIFDSLRFGRLHLTANKAHGKTYMLFSIVRKLRIRKHKNFDV
jgi:hypothetical protein